MTAINISNREKYRTEIPSTVYEANRRKAHQSRSDFLADVFVSLSHKIREALADHTHRMRSKT